MTTLDFCRKCGILLPPDESLKCLNCNADINAKASRIRGEFRDEDAIALLNAGTSDEEDE